jgi:Mrp family chromosome partitioning ATPase
LHSPRRRRPPTPRSTSPTRPPTRTRSTAHSSSIQQQIAALQGELATQTPGERTQTQAKIYDLKLATASTSAGASVVEAAVTADKTSPKLAKDSAIGFTLGLMIALVLFALREAVDTTVRSEADVEEILSAPVLGSVRSLPRRTQIVTLGRHEPMYGNAYALLAAQLAPDTRRSEHSILAVTSAGAGEGKTTTVANLAVSLAKRGEHVLVADFDFHRPTLGNVFEIPRSVAGALQILDGTASLEETLWEVSVDGPRAVAKRRAELDRLQERRVESSVGGSVRPDPPSNGDRTGLGSLLVLPSGKASVADGRARSAQLEPLLRELSAYSTLVMLDTPAALLTAEMTELAQFVDIVVVVVRQGQVKQRALRSLGRHARTWRAELTGAILTDVPAAATRGSYYGDR